MCLYSLGTDMGTIHKEQSRAERETETEGGRGGERTRENTDKAHRAHPW